MTVGERIMTPDGTRFITPDGSFLNSLATINQLPDEPSHDGIIPLLGFMFYFRGV